MNELNRNLERASRDFISIFSELELDYSEKSIVALEELINEKRLYFRSCDPNDNAIISFIFLSGVYLGESIKKKAGGSWEDDEEGQLYLRLNKFTILPLISISRQIFGDESESISCLYRVIQNEDLLNKVVNLTRNRKMA